MHPDFWQLGLSSFWMLKFVWNPKCHRSGFWASRFQKCNVNTEFCAESSDLPDQWAWLYHRWFGSLTWVEPASSETHPRPSPTWKTFRCLAVAVQARVLWLDPRVLAHVRVVSVWPFQARAAVRCVLLVAFVRYHDRRLGRGLLFPVSCSTFKIKDRLV